MVLRKRFLKKFLIIFVIFNLISFAYYYSLYKNERSSFVEFVNNVATNQSSGGILCIVLTSQDYFMNRSIPVWNTWAYKCDKALFASNLKTIEIELSLPFNSNSKFYKTRDEYDTAKQMPILSLSLNESYVRMAAKVFEIVKLVYKHYGNEYRWFFLSDDDTFVFVDNLRAFTLNKSFSEPSMYGYNFNVKIPTGFPSGGAGILYTHESFKRISENIEIGVCNEQFGPGDTALGNCAYKSNVRMGNSLDELGRERFHPIQLHVHYKGPIPIWLLEFTANGVKIGDNCCSEETISFHYETAENMYKYANAVKNDRKLKSISSLL